MAQNENAVNEAVELVKEAQKPSVFNLADVIKERGYPTKEVTIYTDAESAFTLVDLEDKMNAMTEDSDEYKKLEAEAEKLAEVVSGSKLTFLMRGVGQGVVEVVTAKADRMFKKSDAKEDDYAADWFKFYVTSLVAANIVKVTNADGSVDEKHYEYEEMVEIRNHLPADSWGLLVDTMQKLTLATGYFKGMTDAGFLPKS
tara:strand:+ start:744 stop:1343 length:600 start_codon:yes stop_codon:yes gene_type:complete